MKNFKTVTIVTLSIIGVLFAGNIFFLGILYRSVKEQYLVTARQCLGEADVVEILTRMKEKYNYPDSNIKVVFDINHRLTSSGRTIPAFEHTGDSDSIGNNERLMGLAEAFNSTMAYNLHMQTRQSDNTTNFKLLDSIFLAEMRRVGLHPSHAVVLPADSTPQFSTRGMWNFDYSLYTGKNPIYRAYLTYPLGDLLFSTGGIIATTALIMGALAFAFVYLIRTVLTHKTIDEMKQDFVNNMTHELKTPIAAAYSANDTLLNYGKHHDPEKRERYLRLALEQLTRLSELVENILSMSMERRKNFTLNRENISLKPFLDEIAAVHSMKANKDTTIIVNVVPSDLTLDCDPVHFGNVVSNLLDNAIKYSGATVRIDIDANINGISISDNGNGIPAKAIPYIFNKFYRVPYGNRHDIRGYGIGLYYVLSIVQRHGWSIGVESTLSKGSTFNIRYGK